MSDSQKAVEESYDVFIVYTMCDLAIEDQVEDILKGQGLRVTSQKDDDKFKPGQSIFHQVTQIIESSTVTLIILTSESYQNNWILLETILAAEKSIREGKMALRVLYKDLEEHQINKLKKGLLEKVPDMAIDKGPAWERKLVDFVKGTISCITFLNPFAHNDNF